MAGEKRQEDRTAEREGRAERQREIEHDDADVEEASEESFPASDPPSYTPNTSIGPDEAERRR